jgi:hypothetical protein
MKILKKNWNIQELHVTSWILKDMFWCLKFTWLATLMVIPTSILTIYLLITEKNNRDINLTLTSWVFMNVFWMLHELQNLPFWIVQIFMLLGIFNTFRLIVKRRKNESNIFRS